MNEDFPLEIEKRRSKLYPVFKLAKEKKHKVKLQADKVIINSQRYTVDTLDKLPADLQLKNLAERKGDNEVLFHVNKSCFSNFYRANFEINGKTYKSAEQYLQYQKALCSGNQETAAKIMQLDEQGYYLGKKLTPDEQKWNENIAKQVMKAAIRAKFEQNEHLRTEIVNTGKKSLVNCNPYEMFMSCGLKITDDDAKNRTKWKGSNNLGTLILCSVRETLKKFNIMLYFNRILLRTYCVLFYI